MQMGSSKRFLKEEFLDISYVSNIDANGGCSPLIPVLEDWYINEFTNTKMVVALNFSNPIYVSSGDIKDELKVTVKNPYIY